MNTDKSLVTHQQVEVAYKRYSEVGELGFAEFIRMYYVPVYDDELDFIGFERDTANMYLQD